MTLLGKIFTVSILIASLFLMFVAMVVYATHTNWQTAYKGLQAQLTAVQAEKSAAESNYLNLISQSKAELEAQLQTVRQLETARTQYESRNVALERELDNLKQTSDQQIAAVKATEENNNRLMAEVTKLRDSIRDNQQARDAAFTTTLKATSDLHTVSGEYQKAKETNEQLVADLAHVTLKVTEAGMSVDGDVIPRVRGKVSATRRADGAQLIEITVGADDGVKPGQTVEVFRGERYLGRAEILKSDPDRAVGRVLREFQQGQIQEGDDVATKLRVGA